MRSRKCIDITLPLFIMSLTTPLILYKRVLLILNPDIICLSFLGVLPVDLYYTSSIVYILGRRKQTLHLYVVTATNLSLRSSDLELTQRRRTACDTT